MKTRLALFLLLTIFAALTSDPCLSAESAPSVGILYNTQEAHSIVYNCGPVVGGETTCDFVTTPVRFRTTEAAQAAKLAKARKQFASSSSQIS